MTAPLLLTGATGYLGRHVLAALHAAIVEVQLAGTADQHLQARCGAVRGLGDGGHRVMHPVKGREGSLPSGASDGAARLHAAGRSDGLVTDDLTMLKF